MLSRMHQNIRCLPKLMLRDGDSRTILLDSTDNLWMNHVHSYARCTSHKLICGTSEPFSECLTQGSRSQWYNRHFAHTHFADSWFSPIEQTCSSHSLGEPYTTSPYPRQTAGLCWLCSETLYKYFLMRLTDLIFSFISQRLFSHSLARHFVHTTSLQSHLNSGHR